MGLFLWKRSLIMYVFLLKIMCYVLDCLARQCQVEPAVNSVFWRITLFLVLVLRQLQKNLINSNRLPFIRYSHRGTRNRTQLWSFGDSYSTDELCP